MSIESSSQPQLLCHERGAQDMSIEYIENCDGQVVPWFSGPEDMITVAIWHTRSATEF